MNARSEPSRPARLGEPAQTDLSAPLGGTRAQAMHRLQIGIAGVLGILVLIGLVSAIENRAQQTEARSVPEAASTAVPSDASRRSDPLVEAGIVPDLPETPAPTASARVPILPEQGATGARTETVEE